MAYTPGLGSLLKLSIATVFTTVAQQLEFGSLKVKRNPIDVTGLSDTFEVMKPGIRRGDPLPFTCWFDPADSTHQALRTSFTNGTTESWKIIEADTGAAEIAFSGWLEEFEIGSQVVDGYVQLKSTIRLTSDITITP